MVVGLLVLAVILGSVAVTLIAPIMIALYFDEIQLAILFGATAAAYAFTSSALYLTLRGTERGLKRIQSFELLTLSWMLLWISGSLPLFFAFNLDIGNALFETISAISTSNASLIEGREELPRSALFWRIQLQWLGGLLTLLSLVIVLAPAGVGGLPKRQIALLESVGFGGGSRVVKACLNVVTAYTTVSVLCATALFISGVPLFDSLCLAAGAVSTGGFSPISADLNTYESVGLYPILTIFMFIGATSILWQRMFIVRRWHLVLEHRESYFLLAGCFALAIVFGIIAIISSRSNSQFVDVMAIAMDALFMAVSLISTTGYQWSNDVQQHIDPVIIIAVVLIGGGTFSTAGGIKFYRLGRMLVQSINELNRLVFPHSIQRSIYNRANDEIAQLKALWSFLVVAMLIIWVCTAALAFDGIPFDGSLIASIASFSSIGSIYDPSAAGGENWLSYAEMAPLSKIAVGVTMFLGRIEILAFLALFNITYWKTR
ncbi:MAG: TrkH family potassium uptake protein [Rhizobiales bacterium]|nr:TrkH family potassium uptake protein [Hyphomicrobiales bacterium]